MGTSRARLFKELKEVQKDAQESDIVLYPDESNIYKWTAFLKGPVDTPYEGGTFQLAITVPDAYPLVPPTIRYITKIFHPNVHYKVCITLHARLARNHWGRLTGEIADYVLHTLPSCASGPGVRHFGGKTGEICLDILKTAWSPAWTLQSVCRATVALMSHAEPDSPLNCDAGNMLRAGDTRGYNSIAKMLTVEHASVS